MKVRSKNGAELIVEYNDDSIFAENEKGQSAKLNFLNTFGKHKIKKTIVEKKYSESDEIVTEKVYNYKNGIYKSNVGEIYKDDVLSSPELASSIKELAEKFASILQMIEDECEDGAAKVHVPDEPSL